MEGLKVFINRLAERMVISLSLVFISLIAIANFLFMGKNLISDSISNIFIVLLIIIFSIFAIMASLKIKDNRKYGLVLFAVSIIIRILWIFIIKTEPIQDFKIMYEGGMDISLGNYEKLIESYYFSSWVYQLGFTTYLSLFFILFNNPLVAAKVVNVLIVSGIPVLLYFIIKKLNSEKSARICSMFYALYFGSVAYTSVLTNQHIPTLLIYLSIYIVLNKFNNKWGFVVAGFLIAIAQIIRPEGNIVLLALMLFLIFKNFSADRDYFIRLGKLIGIVLIFFVIINMFSNFLINQGITKYKYENRDPLWKVVTGLNYDTVGSYSLEDDELLYGLPLEDKKEIVVKLIKERISNPKELAILIGKKFLIFWGGNDNLLEAIYTNADQYESYNNISMSLEKLQYTIITIFMAIGAYSLYRKKKFSNSYVFLIIFIGYVLAHFIIEIQARYRYFIIPSMIIISSYGIEKLIKNNK